jgi:16S rRNA (guanine1207-N2)-methyltransferase
MTLSDINERAISLSRQNCNENSVECTVVKSDIFSSSKISGENFDAILTNPPFSAGKKTCMEFISQSFKHLKPNGSLQLVAPHNKGGASLKKFMMEVFGNVGELTKKSGYRVYISRKN